MSLRMLENGRYELLDELGSGGMATVYRAQDHREGVIRAIKVLDERFSHKEEILKRFELEAMAMSKLDHKNIVRLYGCHLEGDERYIVMDFIDGDNLLGKMGKGRIPDAEAVRLMIPVVDALQAAHDKGIVHRDIKPHNILLDKSDTVYVSDFGIARCIDEGEESVTRTGMVMGTWAFMAPEQRADAKGVDHLADIYSVGATLYAAVTGEVPKDLFAADLDPSIYRGISQPLESVIRRACAYWSSDRYPSAHAMMSDLEITLDILQNKREVPRDFGAIQFRTNPEFTDTQPPPPLSIPVAKPPEAEQKAVAPTKGTSSSQRVLPTGKRSSSDGEMRVGRMVFGIALILCGIFYLLARDVSQEPKPTEAVLAVEIPAIERKGRIVSDMDDGPIAGRPVLEHAAVDNAVMGEDLVWNVKIPGSNAYDRVQAWYRPQGSDTWSRSRLRRVGDGYKGSIAVDRMLGGGIEYWIEAKPYRKGLPNLSQGSAEKPIRVFVH